MMGRQDYRPHSNSPAQVGMAHFLFARRPPLGEGRESLTYGKRIQEYSCNSARLVEKTPSSLSLHGSLLRPGIAVARPKLTPFSGRNRIVTSVIVGVHSTRGRSRGQIDEKGFSWMQPVWLMRCKSQPPS